MTRIFIIQTIAAIAVSASIAAPVAAAAQGRTHRIAPQTAADTTKIQSAQGGSQAYPNDNVAKEWTLACYAEFGPNASNPDAGLLQKCLDY